MASPAFGTQSVAGGGTAANVTINVPASTADGDWLLAIISKDATGAITAPGGWNNIVNDTADGFHLWIGWRIAASEPASYTWNFASTWRDCYMQRYTGVYGPAPLDPATPAAVVTVTSALTATSNGDTQATAATLIVAIHTAITINTWVAETATVDGVTMTRRTAASNEVHTMDGAKASAGAEGGKAATDSAGAGAMKAYMIGLASVAAGGGGTPVQPPMRMLVGAGI